MRVVLFRHGIAVDREHPRCPPDAERPLTGRGRKRTRAAARGLKRLGVLPDLVLSSPYVRARETAEIAVKVLGGGRDIRFVDALRPIDDPRAVMDLLSGLGAGTVLCAGHNPNLNGLLAALTGQPAPYTWLGKAGAACVTVDDGFGTLAWLLEPRTLRRLGRAG